MYTLSQSLPDIGSREKHPYLTITLIVRRCVEGGEESLDPISVEQGGPWHVGGNIARGRWLWVEYMWRQPG